jgi:putative transposase
VTYQFISRERANHAVQVLCRVLEVSRSAWYAWQAGESSSRALEDQRLTLHIRAAHKASRGTYGSPRITHQLRDEGLQAGRRRVARLMSQDGLRGLPPRPYKVTTNADPELRVAPDSVCRAFTVDKPNEVWVTDITYVHTAQGWLYLAVVIDLFSRKVVGWEAATHMRVDLCLSALRRALALRQPGPGLIHHSDRGCQYASNAYQAALDKHHIRPSMSRKGDCWDNAVAESFFGTLKNELIYRKSWDSPAQARLAISEYIHAFYNLHRRHSANNQQSPISFENKNSSREGEAAA